jgi:hypothetical protein
VELLADCLEAFNLLEQSLISEPIVDYPRKHRSDSLIVNTSTGTGDINGGLGAMATKEKKEVMHMQADNYSKMKRTIHCS